MPTLIPYPTTLATLEALGLQSLYYNSGAFGFPGKPVPPHYIGWVGPADSTLRPEMLPLAKSVAPPYPQTLAALVTRTWLSHLPGSAWLMPMAHWAFELDFGSHEWMPAVLRDVGIDPDQLAPLTTGNAIEFQPAEVASLRMFVEELLGRLKTSDFMLAFPAHPVVCTVHHHQQLWWSTNEPELAERLRAIEPR